MPHPTFADLADRTVGIWGYGMEGRAAARRLRADGGDPVLVDDRPPSDAPDVLATDDGGLDALLACEVVLKSPGISRYDDRVAALVDGGVLVTGALSVWFESVDPPSVIAVTGTKGKSTTSTLITHLARGLGIDAVLAGNVGVTPYDPEQSIDGDLWVVEVSSYQATDFASSPPVVVVTSLGPDHLPWHRGEVETYYRDKLSLCSRPGARVTVANGSNDGLRSRAHLLGPEVDWCEEPAGDWASGLGLVGRHNLLNAELGRRALVAAGVDGADDPSRLAQAAQGFADLASRLEVVEVVDGVTVVDDGLSTNVLSTLAAVDAFSTGRLAVIVGGADRGLDYTDLATGLAARNEPTLVLTAYETGPRIHRAIEDARPHGLELRACTDLEDAVAQGLAWARPDGVLLHSPAASSFDAFVDYRDRARALRDAVARSS